MKITRLKQSLSDRERAVRLFDGELLIFQQRPAMLELIDVANQMLLEALDGLAPPTAQRTLTPEQFLQRTGRAQARFRKNRAVRTLFFEALRQCGVDTRRTCYDHFPMRIVPFDNSHDGALTAAIGHHRDSWGSNIHSQQNWWSPLYPLEPQRSITFYPDYWRRPLANTTDSWTFEKFLASRARSEVERAADYPSAPWPTEAVDESNAIQILLEPGDILSFASAHLHASAINTTNFTRFSVEMRTIGLTDIETGHTAPNVDNAAQQPMYNWFRMIEDETPLSSKLQSTSEKV